MQSATVTFVYGIIEELPLFPSFILFVPFVVGLCLDISHLQNNNRQPRSHCFLFVLDLHHKQNHVSARRACFDVQNYVVKIMFL